METEDDIGADVAAALKEASAPVAEAPEPAAPVEAAPAAEGPARAPDGKFAPKADAAAAAPTTPDQPGAAEAEAQAEPIRPPAAWSAQAKADFAALPKHVQEEVLKRERDMDKGLQDRASQLKRYEPLENVIGPHRDRIHMAGMDEAGYVRSLIAADEMLRGPNKLQAMAQIAQGYGIDLRAFAQGQQPGAPLAQGQQPNPAQLTPQYQQLAQTVAQLQQTIAQQQSAAQQAEAAQHQAAIDSFAKDHLYFENVRPDMAALIRSGQAQDLASAYDMACWSRPDIRPLLLREQETKRLADEAEAARAKASQARQAGGSIAGSPSPGASPTASANSNGSIEDDVRAAYAAHR